MTILSLIFDKAGPVKGSSLVPIHGYRFIFNMMSDLTTGGGTRPAARVVKGRELCRGRKNAFHIRRSRALLAFRLVAARLDVAAVLTEIETCSCLALNGNLEMSFSGDPVHAINSQFAIADGSPCIGMAHLRPAGGCPVAKIPIVRENRPALRGRRRPKMDGLTGFRRVGNVQRDRWSRGRQGSIDNLDQPYRVRRLGTNGDASPFDGYRRICVEHVISFIRMPRRKAQAAELESVRARPLGPVENRRHGLPRVFLQKVHAG